MHNSFNLHEKINEYSMFIHVLYFLLKIVIKLYFIDKLFEGKKIICILIESKSV